MSLDSKLALTVDFLREFIQVYRSHPALWKVGSKEYVDKVLKKKGYDELVNKCWAYNISADRNFVVRKINSLRGAFRKEHNKVLAAASIGQMYVPVLWYYKLLLFTSDKEVSDTYYREGSTDGTDDLDYNVESTEELCGDNSIGGCSGTAASEEGRERKHDVCEQEEIVPEESLPEDHLQVHLDYAKEHLIRPSRIYCRPRPYSPKKIYEIDGLADEFNAIGASVAAKLKRMDDTQRYYAETLMTKVLGMGLLGKLAENTVLITQASTGLTNTESVPVADKLNSSISFSHQ